MHQIGNQDQFFRYQATGVALHSNHVFLQKVEQQNVWVLPGSHVSIGETGAHALKRTFLEKLKTNIQVDRLLWVSESFFKNSDKDHHELGLVYLMGLPPTSPLLKGVGPYHISTDGQTSVYKWFPRDRATLVNLPLMPSFLQESLQILPQSLQHRVHINSALSG